MKITRTNRIILASGCILNQSLMAIGAQRDEGMIWPVVDWCRENKIGIHGMPCPETLSEAGGFGRQPHGKVWYEKRGLRKTSTEIATVQAAYARKTIDAGIEILAIIGVEFSPACAVTYLNRGPVIYKDQGIYVEELIAALAEQGLVLPLIGVNMRGLKKLARQLAELLTESERRATCRQSVDDSTGETK